MQAARFSGRLFCALLQVDGGQGARTSERRTAACGWGAIGIRAVCGTAQSGGRPLAGEGIGKPPRRFPRGFFCVKSNRGIRRLLLDIAVVSNEDSDDRLGGIIIIVYCNEVSLIADTVVNHIGLINSDIFVSVNVPLDEEKCDKVRSKNLFSCHS